MSGTMQLSGRCGQWLIGLLLVSAAAGVAVAAAEASWRVVGNAGHVQVVATPLLDPLRVNQIHAWELRVTDNEDKPLGEAVITATGGMPAHDHGLPTEPRVIPTEHAGVYLMQGVRFHMHGAWEITLVIEAGPTTDVAVLKLEL